MGSIENEYSNNLPENYFGHQSGIYQDIIAGSVRHLSGKYRIQSEGVRRKCLLGAGTETDPDNVTCGRDCKLVIKYVCFINYSLKVAIIYACVAINHGIPVAKMVT